MFVALNHYSVRMNEGSPSAKGHTMKKLLLLIFGISLLAGSALAQSHDNDHPKHRRHHHRHHHHHQDTAHRQ